MNGSSRYRCLAQLVIGAGVLAVFTGCQTYSTQSADLGYAFRGANVANAVVIADREAEAKAGGRDELLWRLEQGAVLRLASLADGAQLPPPAAAASSKDSTDTAVVAPTAVEVAQGYAQRSLTAFDLAEERVNYWEEQARIKVASETFALLSNQATTPYRGRSYDKVMLNTYKALNYLQVGKVDAARVELNRALQRQRDAVEANQKRIEESQAEIDQARDGKVVDENGKSYSYDVDRAMEDPRAGEALNAVLAEASARIKAYGDYVNPFAVFLDGLFFSICGENGSDWERGRKSFERLAGLIPENPYVAADTELANAAAEGRPAENLTYVIFETGLAPSREEVRIDIPTFLVTSQLSYIGAAFPRLRFNDDFASTLTVDAGGQTYSAATVASMDSIVGNDFKNEWPSILTKTLITTATKAIAQAVVQKQLNDQNSTLGLLGGIALGVLNYGTTSADTRTWITLPKEFQYVRLTTPVSRELTLRAGGQVRTITLDPGSVNVVYVKSVSSMAPLFVSQFILK